MADTKDSEMDTVATPEGDNEFPADVPLKPPVGDVEVRNGGAPVAYDADHDKEQKAEREKHHHGGILEVIDELSRGRIET
jgi:hypothetical protein